ncbi:NAD(+) diphosphatase [Flavimaribacter sediminis]|uniref:NAD(+) diphosphatase n=1 Tax=Flavimaribacter sediminis TaxID=2865987 RepID=UPI00215D9046|nr:NAD(+) diphosphatase [Flavimaribacter sediminis]
MSLFNGNGPEPSSFVAFAGNRLERRSEHRDDSVLEEALAAAGAMAFAMRSGRAYLAKNGDGFDALHDIADLDAFSPDFENAVVLGYTDSGAPRLAVPVKRDPDDLPDTIKAIDHRSIYMQGLVRGSELGELAQGASLLAWALSHRFCGRCGEKTRPRAGGYRRECPSCGNQLFPRTDPVVIMLAVDEKTDRCLLGRSPHFAPGMYSCLAGFLEPGETIEEAVRRETLEESGIRIGAVRYHASQPWPMPHSLMIGCYGEALSDRITADTRELEDCRWFNREETAEILSRRVGSDSFNSPPPGAIAHHLIRDWLAGNV